MHFLTFYPKNTDKIIIIIIISDHQLVLFIVLIQEFADGKSAAFNYPSSNLAEALIALRVVRLFVLSSVDFCGEIRPAS